MEPYKEYVERVMEQCKSKDQYFKSWLKSKEYLGGEEGKHFLSSYIMFRLYNIQKSVNTDDRDHFIVVCGKEGTGKSTLAIQLASIVDPGFKLDRVCFKMQQFISKIRTTTPGSAFVLDEGNLFLFSREAMSEDNKFMLKLFALMRQRNLIVIICVPNFFTLDSYVRDHRVDTLIYAHAKGKFIMYKDAAIKFISKEGYRNKQVAGHPIKDGLYFYGTFVRDLPQLNDINLQNYKNYKGEHFDEFLKDLEEVLKNKDKNNKEYVSLKEAEEMIPLSRDTIVKYLNEKRIIGKKLGTKWLVHREKLINFANS